MLGKFFGSTSSTNSSKTLNSSLHESSVDLDCEQPKCEKVSCEKFVKCNGSSRVWTFMLQGINSENKLPSGKAQCKLCKEILICKGGSTSSLLNHLRLKHAVEYNCKDKKGCEKTQLPISSFLKAPRDTSLTTRLDKALIDMIVDGNPLRIVEQHGFQTFCALSAPQYSIPSRRTLVRRINDQYDLEIKNLKQQLICLRNANTRFSLTFDLWSSRRSQCYLTLHLFFINDCDKLIHYCLCTKQLDGRHTSEALSQEIGNILLEFGISNNVFHATTDNGNDVRKACRILNIEHSGCIAHLLHLVIVNGCGLWKKNDYDNYESGADIEFRKQDHDKECNVSNNVDNFCSSNVPEICYEFTQDFDFDGPYSSNDAREEEVLMSEMHDEFDRNSVQCVINKTLCKVRSIVTYFRRSNVAMKVFRTYAHQDLPRDIQTRWNSTFYMCTAFIRNKQAILQAVADERLISVKGELVFLDSSDWKVINDLNEILAIFETATKSLSGSDYITISSAYPVLHMINNHLAISENDNEFLRRLKQQLITQMSTYFASSKYVSNDLLIAAAYLDPRVKSIFFTGRDKRSTEAYIRSINDRLNDLGLNDLKQFQQDKPERHNSNCQQEDDESGLCSPATKRVKLCSYKSNIHSVLDYISDAQATCKQSKIAVHYEKCIEAELALYNDIPLEPTTVDVGIWWHNNKFTLPRLYNIYKAILAIPATSTSAEAAFSIAGNFVRRERAALAPALVNQLCFLKSLRKFVEPEAEDLKLCTNN